MRLGPMTAHHALTISTSGISPARAIGAIMTAADHADLQSHLVRGVSRALHALAVSAAAIAAALAEGRGLADRGAAAVRDTLAFPVRGCG